MSLPKFPDKSTLPTLEQSLSAIVTSIAMEEAALSRLINAESEKIRYVVDVAKTEGCQCTNMKDVLAVNKSAEQMMDTIAKLQAILKEKLAVALKYLPHPPLPPKPPHPPCVSIFTASGLYNWHHTRSLYLTEDERCNNGVRLIRRDCEPLIILPSNRDVEIRFEMEAKCEKCNHAVINFEFRNGNTVVEQEKLSAKCVDRTIKTSCYINHRTPADAMENAMVIKLSSPQNLSCVNAKVAVKVKK